MTLLRTVIAVAALTAAIAAPALLAAPAQAQDVEGVAAIVNDEVISTYDVRQRMRLILVSTGVQPDEQLLMRVQAQALRALIDERIQMQEAREYEIEVEETEVDDAMSNLARQNNTTADQIAAELGQFGVDVSTLEDQLRAEIAWNILISGRYRTRVRVSDDQITDTLRRLAASAAKPSYLISEILIDTPMNVTEEEVSQFIDALYGQIQQGAPFPALARQYSSAASAAQGGDVGWVRSGEMDPEIETVLEKMEPGRVSPPIATSDGIYIIALRDRQTGENVERWTLKQLLVPLAPEAGEEARQDARDELVRRTRRLRDGCDGLEDAAKRINGSMTADLGSVSPADLAQQFRVAVADVEEGGVSAPIDSPAGVLVIGVCDKDALGGASLPSREDVEDRLLDQQLSQLSRRYLRDLRRSATIETRVR